MKHTLRTLALAAALAASCAIVIAADTPPAAPPSTPATVSDEGEVRVTFANRTKFALGVALALVGSDHGSLAIRVKPDSTETLSLPRGQYLVGYYGIDENAKVFGRRRYAEPFQLTHAQLWTFERLATEDGETFIASPKMERDTAVRAASIQAPAPLPPPTTLFGKIHYAYMHADAAGLPDLLKHSEKQMATFTDAERKSVATIRSRAREPKPAWWPSTKSSKNVTFTATLWGRSFKANYMPSESLGQQMPVGYNGQRLFFAVSWRPQLVDNPEPLPGSLAGRHALLKSHLGEAIVWHELGHNYISEFLPLAHVVELYNNHRELFSHMQEFYADLTAIYHSSPPARRAVTLMRLDEFDRYREDEPHTRAAHAIGALFLATVLENPAAWPNVHLPPEVPTKRTELETLRYVYETLDPAWTVEEDEAWRKTVERWIRANGESALRSRGTITLPNRLSMKVLIDDDRELQVKRDNWVADKLKRAIAAGRADKASQSTGARINIMSILLKP